MATISPEITGPEATQALLKQQTLKKSEGQGLAQTSLPPPPFHKGSS